MKVEIDLDEEEAAALLSLVEFDTWVEWMRGFDAGKWARVSMATKLTEALGAAALEKGTP